MPADLKPRVLAVDDHPMVREGLKSMLAEDVAAWAEAASGEEAVRKVPEFTPDLVLLDLQLPDLDGLTVLRRIKLSAPAARVLIVTMHDHAPYVQEAIKLGASGYVLKGITRRELLAAVRAVLEGGSVIDPRLLSRVVEAVAAEPGSPPSWATAEPLTPLERQVLTLVTHGLTNREAADRLGCSVGTVKKYVQRIIEKLQVTDRTQAAVEAVRRGLIRDFHLPPGSPPAEP